MPHIITQSCCSDGSCVYACPVNCIHPTPDEPGFGTAEMLHIDPVACVDCGACVSACPVGAIAPDSKLTTEQLPFIEINASFYPKLPVGEKLPPTSKLAPVIDAPMIRQRGSGPLRVAVVGSGPAAMYAAEELLTQHGVRVNVFEKLPTPYGLVRAGVAPDHQTTKRVTRLFDRMARHRGFEFYLNVEVGQHLSHDELLAHHHAVVYAVGASSDRRLDIEGFGIAGTATATELVAWINAHPDYTDLAVPLDHERVVIIGNGNVALDVARILTADPKRLAGTDISRHALAALRDSKVREVVIAARRGPAQSAFTLPEMIGLTAASRVVLSADDHELVRADLAACTDALTRHKLELLASLDIHDERDDAPVIRLAYRLTPSRVLGDQRAAAVEFSVTGTDELREVDAGLVLSSIGYHGRPVPRLAVRRRRRCRAQSRRPRRGPEHRVAGHRLIRHRLDQAGSDRLHRDQQVLLSRNGQCARRRLQPGPAARPGGRPAGVGQAAGRQAARSRRPRTVARHRPGRDRTRPSRRQASRQVRDG